MPDPTRHEGPSGREPETRESGSWRQRLDAVRERNKTEDPHALRARVAKEIDQARLAADANAAARQRSIDEAAERRALEMQQKVLADEAARQARVADEQIAAACQAAAELARQRADEIHEARNRDRY